MSAEPEVSLAERIELLRDDTVSNDDLPAMIAEIQRAIHGQRSREQEKEIERIAAERDEFNREREREEDWHLF